MDVNSRVLEPRGLEKVAKLIDRGVRIPNPLTVDIDEAVDIDNISSDGVVIGPDAESVAVGLSSQPGAYSGMRPP